MVILDLLGEWMFGQCYVGSFFVIPQGSVEKLAKTGRSRSVPHHSSGKEVWPWGKRSRSELVLL